MGHGKPHSCAQKGIQTSVSEPTFHAFIPGSGCSLLEQVVSETIDKNVTAEQYVLDFQEFLDSESKENVAKELKNCFLGQDDYTLANVKDFVVISISSLSAFNPLDRDKQPLSLTHIMPKQVLTMLCFSDFHCW